MGWTLIAIVMLALAGFALWRWALAAGSAGTLDWIDARFSRETGIELAAQGNYGPEEAQRAEIWVPEGAAPAGGYPLAVFVHGGGWHSGAPEDYRFVARSLGERGIATALGRVAAGCWDGADSWRQGGRPLLGSPRGCAAGR